MANLCYNTRSKARLIPDLSDSESESDVNDELNKTVRSPSDFNVVDESEVPDDTLSQTPVLSRKSLSTWDLEEYSKLVDEVNSLRRTVEILQVENLEMQNCVIKKDEAIVRLEGAVVQLTEEIRELKVELHKKDEEEVNLLRTVGVLSDDMRNVCVNPPTCPGPINNMSDTNHFLEDIDFHDENDYFSDFDTFLEKESSVNSNKNNVLILADSHGRQLAELLHPILPYNVQVIFKPSAKFNQVISDVTNLTKKFTKNDHVFIIAGCNDCNCKLKTSSFDFNLSSLSFISQITNVHVFNVFDRHDCTKCNDKVVKFNIQLQQEILKTDIKSINLLHILKRNDFTKKKLHLNLRGKQKIVSLIVDILKPNVTFLLSRQGEKCTR